MKLSEKILNLRKQAGLSQEELADKLSVSRQAVSRWELGSAQPDASNLLQLSKLFGVSADYLLNDDMERDSSSPGQSPAKPRSWKKIAALCAAAFGALGHAVIYILSRCVEVQVPFVHYDETGQKWHTWSSGHTGRSYKFFIQEYDLEVLTVLLWLLLLVGLSYAFLLPKIKKWRSA